MVKEILDRIPKSFLLGISLASILWGIVMVLHLSLPKSGSPEESDSMIPLPDPGPPTMKPARKSHLGFYSEAAVATDAEECAKIGVDVLRLKGTAVDAALATVICAGVVHPFSMGLGGGFVMTVYKRDEQKAYTLVSREKAPGKATKDMFKGKKEASTTGALAVAVPGELRGYLMAKERFGNPDLTIDDLLRPSIRLCEEGVPVTRTAAKVLTSAEGKIRKDGALSKVFINPKTDHVYQLNERYKRPKLATTLRRIGLHGAEEIYGGKTGKAIVEELQARGGIITEEDFKNYEAVWEDAVSVNLNVSKLTLFTTPPPTSGPVLAGILGIMDRFLPDFGHPGDMVNYQRFIEACKYGFAKRTLIGDWRTQEEKKEEDAIRQLADELTSFEWINEIRHKIRDDFTSGNATYYGAHFVKQVEDDGTSHTSVLAPNGDAVGITSTINTYFGSGIMSPSTGIILNNEMDDFATCPTCRDSYGILPSPRNFVHPGRRPVSSMVPTIIVDSVTGKVRLVVGASGGPKIITATAFVAMQHLWLGKNIKEAIDAPRVHHQLSPMKISYDRYLDETIVQYLRSVGHNTTELPRARRGSVVQAVAVEGPGSGTVTANADFRKAGEVDGFEIIDV